MQYTTTTTTPSVYEPFMNVFPHYYDPLNSFYIDPSYSCYFASAPMESNTSSPTALYYSPPPYEYPPLGSCSPYDYSCGSPSSSDCSYVPPKSQPKTRSGGGGKKRVTKSTRAKRNQVVCEHTHKKNNKQNKEDNDDDNDDDKQFKCIAHDCGKVFKRAEHLKRHVKSIHDRIKDYKCNFPGCDRAFSRSDNLNQHLRTHRSESMIKKKKAN